MGWLKVDTCKMCGREVHGKRIILEKKGREVKGWKFQCFCGKKFFVAKNAR